MRLVVAAILVTALNLVSTELWAGSGSVSVVDAKQKPVFARVKASEEDKSEEDKKKKKKKKKGKETEEEEPECD